MRINDSIFLGAIVPELDNGALVIQQNKRILFLSLLSRLIEVVVRGTSPLSLLDAIANSLEYLKAFGGTELIPETYLDTVTAEGKCEQGLPDGYTAIQYVENTSGTYVDLGVPFNDADSYMTVTAVAQNTNYIFCAREGNVMQGIAGGSTSSFKAYIDPVSLTSTTTKTAGHKYNFAFRANNGNATFETEDETATTGDTQTTVYTVSQTQPTAHLCLFGNTYGNVSDAGMQIYGATYTVGGKVVRNLIPARKGATIGLFDLVSRQFFTATQGSLMAGQDTTIVPTPDAPLDIWCNNGVLKVRHQSGLPLGYTLLDYIESTGTQWIDTGVKFNGNKSVIEAVCVPATIPTGGFWKTVSATQGGSPTNRWGGIQFYNSNLYCTAGSTSGESGATVEVSANVLYDIKVITDVTNGTNTLIANGVTNIISISNACYTNSSLYLLAKNTDGNAGELFQGRLYKYKLTIDDVLVCNFIPAKNSSDVVGMYDTVSGTFFTNAGTGDFVAGNPVNDIEIYADGTTETITDDLGNTATCQNLLSVSTYEDTQEVISGAITRNVGIKVFDGTESWIGVGNYFLMELNGMLNSSYGQYLCNKFVARTSGGPGDIQFGSNSNILYFFEVSSKPSGVTDVASWKQWLADQYNAGTPVIVVYPLATATTESVAGQTLLKAPLTTVGSLENLVVTPTSSSHTVPTPTQPLDIVSNNGVIKYGQYGGDLFTTEDAVYGYYINASGEPKTNVACFYTKLIPVVKGQSYIFSGKALTGDTGRRIHAYVNGEWLEQLTYAVPAENEEFRLQFTIPQNADAIRISLVRDDKNVQLKAFGVYADGTVETINVHGKNLFNENSTFSVGQYDNGVWSVQNDRLTTDYIMISPNTNYTVSVDLTNALNLGLVNYNYFDKDKTWLGNRSTNGDSGFGDQKTKTFNISNADTRYVKITIRKSNNADISAFTPTQAKIQLELGSTATDYEPYFNGGTATAEMLLKVGNYEDVQEILSGAITRKVGVKVLDGTEDWTVVSGAYSYFRTNDIVNCITDSDLYCNNFVKVTIGVGSNNQGVRLYREGDTSALFLRYDNLYSATTANIPLLKQWLSDQYAAGTPVIIIYPLATPTTESVAGQALQVQQGDNIVEITQAAIDGLELEAKYQAAVTLTIQEVQDANLDPNVQVTIN